MHPTTPNRAYPRSASWLFLLVFSLNTSAVGCPWDKLAGLEARVHAATGTLGTLVGALRHLPPSRFPELQWFRFNTARVGETPHYVRIPYVDLGAEPFRSRLIPENQRNFQPHIEQGAGFSKMVQGQAVLSALPAWVRRFLAERSLIMRGYLLNDGAFFADMPTYFLRLGTSTQPWLVDRLAAADKLSQYILERTREMSSAGARELTAKITQDDRRPIRLFSIGGGPMVDTLNMLLKLQRDEPGLMARLRANGTPIRITLADISDTGAAFGREALERFQQPGQPLHGLNLSFEYVRYDWSRPETLDGRLSQWGKDREFVLIHSEGAIGEYGSDAILQSNLTRFADRLPSDATFVLSAFLPDAEFARLREERGLTNITVFPRNTADLARVANAAGWTVDSGRTVNILDQTFVTTLRRP